MSAKIYILTAGSYSDYRIIAAFTTHEKARAFSDTFPCGECQDIEEYDLDSPLADMAAHGYSVWRVLMARDGAVKFLGEKEADPRHPLDGEYELMSGPRAAFYFPDAPQRALDARVWATSKEHAIKITNERRAHLIASGSWEP